MERKAVGIKLEQLKSGKFDVRSEVDDDAIDALAASISRVGLINPIRVVSGDSGYTVVSGHRRLAACKKISLGTVPCILTKASDAGLKETALAENIFRKDLTPVELAAACKDILQSNIMEADELAVAMHRTVHWVLELVLICGWPDCLQQAVHVGAISVAAARPLVQVTNLQYLEYLVEYACQNGATARTTAAWLQAWRAAKPPSEAIQAEPIPGRAESPAVIPCSPCLGCHENFRTDSVAHMPLCPDCLAYIRAAADSGAFKK